MQRLSGIEIDDVAALDAASVDRPQLAKDIACIIKEVLEDVFFHKGEIK